MPTNSDRILYIGPYREFSGAGNSARNYIHALYRAGYNVCIAPIYLTGDIYPENEISSEILPLENNYLKKYDIIIQHCHPFDYIQDSKFDLSVGIFQFNTQNLPKILRSRFSLVDKIVVNSRLNKNILQSILSHKDVDKVKYVPELICKELKNKDYSRYEWLKQSDPYIFYAIGDFIPRKNFLTLASAYIKTFRPEDNVQLIIKTKPHHLHNNYDILYKEVDYEISRIYDANKITKSIAPNIKMMMGKFQYDKLLNLHYNGSCYVDISKGENFGYATLEASFFNKDIIVNKEISSAEIVDTPYMVSSNIVSVNDPYTKSFVDNNTHDTWTEIDYNSLCENLRLSWLNRYSHTNNYNLQPYEYENIGNLLC